MHTIDSRWSVAPYILLSLLKHVHCLPVQTLHVQLLSRSFVSSNMLQFHDCINNQLTGHQRRTQSAQNGSNQSNLGLQ